MYFELPILYWFTVKLHSFYKLVGSVSPESSIHGAGNKVLLVHGESW